MRARLTLALVLALLVASCGEDEGFFSTLTTGSTAAPVTTEAGGSTSTAAEGWASTTTFPVAGTTTTTAAPVREWAWTRLAADGSFFGGEDDQSTLAVAAHAAGLVAVGSEWMGEEFDAAAWTSTDGLVWSRVPHDESVFGGPDYQRMFGVTAGGPGLVAVGIDGSGGDWDAAVWISADGLAWSRVPHDESALGGPGRQGMSKVVAGGPGLVAIGWEEGGDDDVAVWTSPDGLAWSRVPHDEEIFGGSEDQYADGLAVGGPGLVVAGSDYSGGDGEAAVWVSSDGTVWSRLARQAAFGGLGDHWMAAVTSTGAGLVAVGAECAGDECDGAAWTSVDGLTWSRVVHDEAVFGGDGDQVISGVTSAGGGLVAVGRDESGGDLDGAVWISVDGLTWSRVAHDEAVFGGPLDQRMWEVVAGGPGLVAIGEYDTGGDRDGAMWVAVPAG